jgi:hypothetical protein
VRRASRCCGWSAACRDGWTDGRTDEWTDGDGERDAASQPLRLHQAAAPTKRAAARAGKPPRALPAERRAAPAPPRATRRCAAAPTHTGAAPFPRRAPTPATTTTRATSHHPNATSRPTRPAHRMFPAPACSASFSLSGSANVCASRSAHAASWPAAASGTPAAQLRLLRGVAIAEHLQAETRLQLTYRPPASAEPFSERQLATNRTC